MRPHTEPTQCLTSDKECSLSAEEARASVAGLTTSVEEVLRINQDISRRVATLETRSNPANESTSLTAPNRTRDSIQSKPSSIHGQFDPDLNGTINAARVYVRTAHRRSRMFMDSRHESVAGTSIFSGISLAQLSHLSVISLPIYSHELRNSQMYSMPRNVGLHPTTKVLTSTDLYDLESLDIPWPEALALFDEQELYKNIETPMRRARIISKRVEIAARARPKEEFNLALIGKI